MIMTKLQDHEKPDGTIDWKSYYASHRRNGETCLECGGHITFASGQPTTCNDCSDAIKSKTDTTHPNRVRCPKCRHLFGREEIDYYREEVDTYCPRCDHEFTFVQIVSVSFRSPAMIEMD